MATNAVTADVDVVEVRRSPADRTVTVVAGVATRNMGCVLARGDYAIVAGAAHTNNLSVINRHDRYKRVALMAVLTDGRRQYVVWILAGCVRAVMAGATRTQYLVVINGRHWSECCCAMAILTDIGRLHMHRILASRFGTVVAAKTIRRDIRVIKIHWQPSSRAVAVIAIGATLDVCRMFASGNDAIMARAASANNLGVVDGANRYPHGRRVAVLANIR